MEILLTKFQNFTTGMTLHGLNINILHTIFVIITLIVRILMSLMSFHAIFTHLSLNLMVAGELDEFRV